MKAYRFGLDGWGLLLFVAIMVPNILWGLLAGEGDLLMQPTAVPVLDMVVSAAQVLTIAGMLCLRRREEPAYKPWGPLIFAVAYLLMWALYGLGIVHPAVPLGLAVFPCAAILLHLIRRYNIITLVPATLFAAGHVLSAMINFVF